jgi:cbb3-type cytochrome oxidase subunit 3
MKKVFVMLFSLLLIAFLSTAFNSPGKKAHDKDVGYSLTINDQNNIVTIPSVQSPVIAGEVSYLIARGVSVPDKGLISSDAIIYNDQESFECNLYYTIDRIDLKLPVLPGFKNQPDKYPFASDLGLRES